MTASPILRMLVIPAEMHPNDESFLEEVHTRSNAPIARTFLMRSTTAIQRETLTWNEANLEVIPTRPTSAVLHWLTIYFFDLRYLGWVWEVARRDRPHVAYVRDLTFPLLLALALRPFFHWKVIFQRTFPHEHGWFDPYRVQQYRWPWLYASARRFELSILRTLLGHADAVIPISERMGQELVSEGTCRAERVHAFGMGVTHEVLDAPAPPRRAPGDPLRLVYVGTLALRRRLERLVEAIIVAREVHQVDAHLTVLGGTPQEVESLRAVVKSHEAGDFVNIRGRIPRSQVYAAMADHHAGAIFIARDPRFVVASTTKLVESLAMGLPCVCTDAVAMHAQVAEQTNAIVLTDDTAEGFAAGIAELESRWFEFAERALEARQPVYEHYSYETARERMDALAFALVDSGRSESTSR